MTGPHIWKYEEIRPLIMQAGELVTGEDAARRGFLLVNPERHAPYTTDTISSGFQALMANEKTIVHRHTAFSATFIIEGAGFATINGRRVPMKRGDVVLTPSWDWHNQDSVAKEPLIWLDMVDVSTLKHLPAGFVEFYKDQQSYPADPVEAENSPLVFPWADMKAKLDADQRDWVSVPYLRKSCREVSRTLGCSAERLSPGATSPPVRETASAVYHVIEGSGYSVIDGQEVQWSRGDTFCIPAWHRYCHFASVGAPVYLVRSDDKPMLNALGFYRNEHMDAEALVEEW
ncbi:Gentisate -dioxygenase protein [Neofusicoccum parvum]|uniref:Gentisate -dioxygenase protein n=1 Tax=Neofusicoccum parvum TaxID=310453 RepID=A0ACB5SB29_9PEZI|nr:Gentisate -dioxygenase protein [Neofusicoccum parvum]